MPKPRRKSIIHAIELADLKDNDQMRKYIAEMEIATDNQAEALASLNLAWKDGYAASKATNVKDPALMGRFGDFLKATARRDAEKISNMGGAGSLPQIQAGAEYGSKTVLGTPLTSDAVTGSYTVPVEFMREVQRLAEESSELMPLVKTVPMTSRTMSVPIKNAGMSLTWITSQAGDVAEANPTFQQDTLTAYTGAMYVPVTEEIVEDNAVALGQYIMELFVEAWTEAFDKALLVDSSPFTGLLSDTGVNEVSMSAGETQFDNLDLQHIDSLIQALDSRAKRKGARLILHPTILDILANVKDANGNFKWQQSAAMPPSRIRGYQFVQSDQMPDSGDTAAETPFLAMGRVDTLMFGDRVSLELKYYENTIQNVENCESFFRCRVRAGFLIAQPANFAVLKTAGA